MPPVTNNRNDRLFQQWFSDQPVLAWPQRAVLWAASLLYRGILALRRAHLKLLAPPQSVPGLRVIAVGNLIVGGAGKTPCVIGLAQGLKESGLRCGIVSRGYRSAAEHQPSRVIDPSELGQTPSSLIGDEAWLLAWRTQLPIAVGKNRLQGAQALKARHPDLQVVLLDDGLQQSTLAVDVSVLVLDDRGFGNGHCLPLGPLREPIGDLNRFSAWIDNGFGIRPDAHTFLHALPQHCGHLSQRNAAWVPLQAWSTPGQWLGLAAGIEKFRNRRVLATAGIAVPARFFKTLSDLGLSCDTLALEDHDPKTIEHVQAKWETQNYDLVLMTEKDAVKFFNQAQSCAIPIWALRREAQLDHDFLTRFVHGLQTA